MMMMMMLKLKLKSKGFVEMVCCRARNILPCHKCFVSFVATVCLFDVAEE